MPRHLPLRASEMNSPLAPTDDKEAYIEGLQQDRDRLQRENAMLRGAADTCLTYLARLQFEVPRWLEDMVANAAGVLQYVLAATEAQEKK